MANELIFNVLMALIVAVCGVICKELLPLIRSKKDEAFKRIEQTKWAWAVEIVEAVVRAVEQTVLDEHGEDKKLIAKRLIHKAMKEAGIFLSNEQIDLLIEAAVNTMNDTKIPEVVTFDDQTEHFKGQSVLQDGQEN